MRRRAVLWPGDRHAELGATCSSSPDSSARQPGSSSIRSLATITAGRLARSPARNPHRAARARVLEMTLPGRSPGPGRAPVGKGRRSRRRNGGAAQTADRHSSKPAWGYPPVDPGPAWGHPGGSAEGDRQCRDGSAGDFGGGCRATDGWVVEGGVEQARSWSGRPDSSLPGHCGSGPSFAASLRTAFGRGRSPGMDRRCPTAVKLGAAYLALARVVAGSVVRAMVVRADGERAARASGFCVVAGPPWGVSQRRPWERRRTVWRRQPYCCATTSN
jgi:hypothetical protein